MLRNSAKQKHILGGMPVRIDETVIRNNVLGVGAGSENDKIDGTVIQNEGSWNTEPDQPDQADQPDQPDPPDLPDLPEMGQALQVKTTHLHVPGARMT